MNQQTEQNINEAIDWLQKTGGQVQDFAMEQAPLYCQEVIQWTLTIGIIMTCVFVIATVGAFFLARTAKRETQKSTYQQSEFNIIGGSIGAAILILCAIPMAFEGISRIIKAVTAPRMVIVEHFKSL